MKTIAAIAAMGLVSLGYAGSASAGNYHFTPERSNFTANGSITVTAAAVSLPCTAVLTGHITSQGEGKITSASFSGVSCGALTASNLPWGLTTHSATGASFRHVTVSALVLGICGPGRVKATVGQGGKITISGAGLPGLVPCSVSGTLITTPPLHIVHD